MTRDPHRTLKSRAAKAGLAISDYLLAEVHEVESRPMLDEIRARIESREPVTLPESPAEIIRAMRDGR